MLNRLEPADFVSFVSHILGEGLLSEEDATRLQKAYRSTGQASDVIATQLGIFADQQFAQHLANYCEAELLPRDKITADNDCIQQFFPDEGILNNKAVIPASFADSTIKLVLADPFDREFLDALIFQTNCHVEISIATRADILDALQEYQSAKPASTENPDDIQAIHESGHPSNEVSRLDLDRLNSLAMDAPTVKAVQEIIQSAVLSDATDIHIEPEEHFLNIRLRIDGFLVQKQRFPIDMHSGIISRIKILSRLNIAERRLPQDGRMRMTIRGIEVDFRVSIVPAMKGEMIVLRILNRERVKLNFRELGFDSQDIAKFEKLLANNHGILLVTGPTNSGKSTSLYTALSTFKASDYKIITVEDPVELQLEGINQIQVNAEIGLDFPNTLRSVLRQDPDILMIGEIRDAETAQIAIRAAITGHLVLATLHTNSAAGAVTRLRDIGIEDYLIAATLRGVVSQRLLRTRCANCADGETEMAKCSSCNNTGYYGRTVVREILVCDEATSRIIGEGGSEDKIFSHSTRSGMRKMSDCALELIKTGRTSREEAARVTNLL
ncbi:MAG: type II/IV secretion system protein [Hyphomicrobiales bacterium]|nr:type II/IV secretion system protein [Hyphomicrobiales bacterium]